MRKTFWLGVGLAGLWIHPVLAQAPAAKAPETWWLNRPKAAAYVAPNRPLWKIADLKKKHAGQSNWQEEVVRDPQTEATYNSAAPGTKFAERMHPDAATVFVVTAGEVHFNVEGQQPITAKRGAIVNILRGTIYSYDVTGTDNALWVEINDRDYKTVYPASGPAPKPGRGEETVKVAFNHVVPAYTAPNKLMVNTFDVLADCKTPQTPGVVAVDEPHYLITMGIGYFNAADNPCGTGQRNVGSPEKPGEPPFNTKGTTFGHLHPGEAEWWIIQVGAVIGRFENNGVWHATEGDVMYAQAPGWHQMGSEAPSGPSVRLAIFSNRTFSMVNTAGGGE